MSLDKKFFFKSEHVSSQIWCQKFFPVLGERAGGGLSSTKNFFSQSEHVSSQIWCQKFFPLLGGGPISGGGVSHIWGGPISGGRGGPLPM